MTVQRAPARRYPHIDGLRCLAIVSVVFYHAGLGGLDGGFVGVDIFFVISGFLIISGLYRELQTSSGIKFGQFYFRRVRRLFPALIPVLGASLLAGAALFNPAELKALSASTVAAILFSSNIYFFSKGGYFAEASETQPLLHTWSLSVEEQFYVVIPILLALIWRFGRPVFKLALVVLTLASLGLALATMGMSQKAAFFLAPQRAWELLLGGLVGVLGEQYRPSTLVRTMVGLASALLIVGVIALYNPSVPFPGLLAIPPAVAAAGLIWADLHERTVVGRVLSFPPFVAVGALSYALYLWHWPILVYSRDVAVDDLSQPIRLGLVALSFVAAWASTRFIEDRAQASFTAARPARLLVPAIACSILVAGLASLVFMSGGWSSRRTAEEWRIASRETWRNPDIARCFTGTLGGPEARTVADIRAGRLCHVGVDKPQTDFILWGDSHAEALRQAFNLAGQRTDLSGLFVGEGGCPPVIGIDDRTRGSDFHCGETNQAALALIGSRHIPLVVLHSRWVGMFTADFVVPTGTGGYVHGDDRQGIMAALLQTIDRLHQMGAAVVVVGAMPEAGYDVPGALAGFPCCGKLHSGAFEVRQDGYDRAADINDNVLGPVLRRRGIPFANPLDVYCRQGHCPVAADTTPIYYDYRHVSTAGAALFADRATQLLEAGVRAEKPGAAEADGRS